MPTKIPTKFFDMLPLPIAVVKNIKNLNQPLVYVNRSFTDIIGWDLTEIPDKNHWWKLAFPDHDYQKVVERLWEMSIEPQSMGYDKFVMVTVNVTTKHNGEKRFKIYTELESGLLDGHTVVAFEEVAESFE